MSLRHGKMADSADSKVDVKHYVKLTSPEVERNELNVDESCKAIDCFPFSEEHPPPLQNTSRCNISSEVSARKVVMNG